MVDRLGKAGFLWQFAGGFVLGATALIALQPADSTRTLVAHFRPAHLEAR